MTEVQVDETTCVVEVIETPVVVEVIEGDTTVVEIHIPGPQGPAGPGGSISANDTEILFADGNAIVGDATLTFDSGTKVLTAQSIAPEHLKFTSDDGTMTVDPPTIGATSTKQMVVADQVEIDGEDGSYVEFGDTSLRFGGGSGSTAFVGIDGFYVYNGDDSASLRHNSLRFSGDDGSARITPPSVMEGTIVLEMPAESGIIARIEDITEAGAGYATAAQGALADSAVQPDDLATVATSGAYADLTGKPTLGTAAAANTGDFDPAGAASAAQAAAALDASNKADAAQAAAIAASQPVDSDLTAIAALSTTSYGRSLLALADAAAGRTAFGLGTLATQSGTFSGTSSGTNTGDQDLSGYLLSANAASTYQGILSLAANTFYARSSSGAAANKTISDAGLALIDDADASAMRTTLGLVIGTNVLAYDADLAAGIASIRSIPQNSQSTAYTAVLTDAGKHLLHPSADTTARTFTIPANSSVAYPIGTALTFVNQNSAGVVTIAITTDTMRLAGAGTTGSRTLAANGIATALKVTSTEWIISGTGLS